LQLARGEYALVSRPVLGREQSRRTKTTVIRAVHID
jgi:hypothetical protein